MITRENTCQQQQVIVIHKNLVHAVFEKLEYLFSCAEQGY